MKARLVFAASVALLLGVVLFTIVRFTGPSQRVPIMPATGPAVPAGMQPVSYHGVQIFVPASWHIRTSDGISCGGATTSYVVTPIVGVGSATAYSSCPQASGRTTFTAVEFAAADSTRGQQLASVATEPVTVDGHPGFRGDGVPKNTNTKVAVLVVSDHGVVIGIRSPDADTAQRIFDSASVVATDSIGCASRVLPLAPRKAAERAGASSLLVPGKPTTTVACLHDAGWMIHAVKLAPAKMESLRGILNALPPGTSQPGPDVGISQSCFEDKERGYIVRFAYASGPGVDVFVHISGCIDVSAISASNGSRTTKINEPLVTLLTNATDYGWGFPDPSKLL